MSTSNNPPPTAEADEVPVEALTEEWAEYRVADGTRVFAKTLLVKVIWPAGGLAGGGFEMNIGGTNVLSIFGRRGTPEPPRSPEQILSLPREVVAFETVREPWNYYRIDGDRGLLKVRTSVTTIQKAAGHFDVAGQPLYLVTSGVVGGRAEPQEVIAALDRLRDRATAPIH